MGDPIDDITGSFRVKMILPAVGALGYGGYLFFTSWDRPNSGEYGFSKILLGIGVFLVALVWVTGLGSRRK